VAEPCREIAARPEEAYTYTAKGNLVAVVSNGTAVLGLGNIGPLAAKPVMEGKGILFKAFADIDVFDLEVGSEDPEDMIRFCRLLEPTVGGINLEDIRSPDCFYIEKTLRDTLTIPVFHDDQHGTAIITGAALLNALELVKKDIGSVQVVFAARAPRRSPRPSTTSGWACHASTSRCATSGAWCTPTATTWTNTSGGLPSGGNPDARRGPEGRGRVRGTVRSRIVTGRCSRHGQAADRVRPGQSNPEITPEEARQARSDAIIATGRSDYPNQVNNVLGFPFIFRGALDVRRQEDQRGDGDGGHAALAALAKEEVPDAVMRAYGLDRLRFGADYLIPKPFDPRVLLWVAPAVAWAAVGSGSRDV